MNTRRAGSAAAAPVPPASPASSLAFVLENAGRRSRARPIAPRMPITPSHAHSGSAPSRSLPPSVRAAYRETSPAVSTMTAAQAATSTRREARPAVA